MISITTNSDTFFGLYVRDDSNKEEKTYRIGHDDNMPIALFLLLHSRIEQPIARYCYLMNRYEAQAKEWAKEVDEKANDEIVQAMAKQFDAQTPFLDNVTAHYLSHPEERGKNQKMMHEAINNQPRDIVLPLNLYSTQFATHFAQKTADFDAISRGTIMTCPPSYIGYWQRPEFSAPYKAIDQALDLIMEDVIRIMKLKGFHVTEYNNTVHAPGFKSAEFKHYYGW
jgi:hypothetical protein